MASFIPIQDYFPPRFPQLVVGVEYAGRAGYKWRPDKAPRCVRALKGFPRRFPLYPMDLTRPVLKQWAKGLEHLACSDGWDWLLQPEDLLAAFQAVVKAKVAEGWDDWDFEGDDCVQLISQFLQWLQGPEHDGLHPPDRFVWQGKEVKLTSQQYALMACLWKSKRATWAKVTRHVWGTDQVNPDTVDKAITRLNKKLKDSGIPFRVGRVKNGFVLKQI